MTIKELLIISVIVCLFVLITSFCHAEVIVWKYEGEPTVEKCLKDSNNTFEVCKELVKQLKADEKGQSEIKQIFEGE